MEMLILLYKHLDGRIKEDTERIVCYGVSGRYRDLLCDFAANEGLSISFDEQAEAIRTDWVNLLSGFCEMGLTLVDILLSILLQPVFQQTSAKVVVDYPVGRPDTLRPIEQRLNIGMDALFSSLTLSYLKNHRLLTGKEISDFPLFCAETVRGLLSQIQFSLSFAFDTAIGRQTEATLVAAVEDKTGLHLECTVSRLYRRAAAFNMGALLRYGTASRSFERSGYRVLLLTSGGPTGKALGLAAQEKKIPIYMLPHSIADQYFGLEEQFPHTVFTEGSITKPLVAMSSLLDTVGTGLPKHQEIRNQRARPVPGADDGTVLVGTQPYDDDRRETFVTDVVTAVLEATNRPVVLKIHPGETEAFYRSHLDNLDLAPAERKRVTVTGSDLYRHIVDSDLLVTISSNVGIESVILDTPAVSYNPWTPDNRAPLYCKYGSIPHVETPDAFRDLLSDTDLDTLAADQAAMLDGPYAVADNSLDRIASRVEAELREQLPAPE
jgi:hypothetical protein